MEIASIKGDAVLLLYHPAQATAEVGQQFQAMELPSKIEGLVIQIISNDSLEYPGIQQEMIQRILEQRAATTAIVNREQGMEDLKHLKVAAGKIRKRIRAGSWEAWDGWIPSRNVEITQITGQLLLQNVLPAPTFPLNSFASFDGTAVAFDGPRFNMVNVVTGVKGAGKSHLAKHLALALTDKNVPCIVYDINGEYLSLPNVQVLRWGDNFVPDLAEVGTNMLSTVIQAVYPLPENSRNVFNARLPQIYALRRTYCQKQKQAFTIDLNFLKSQTWGGGQYVEDAIANRIDVIARQGLFASSSASTQAAFSSLAVAYANACAKQPIVFDMRELTPALQRSLVRAMNRALETICEGETKNNTNRYPFVFFEEAHFYVDEAAILNIITRGRHIGMASVFATNTPDKLPDTVFRQLDNLFLLSLTHRDDIRNVSKNSFTDQDTIESFATRMPKWHALVMGNITERYPLVVKIDPLPLPPTGQTKSTWDRFVPAAPTVGTGASQPTGTLPTAAEQSAAGDSADETVVEYDDPFADE